MGRYGMMQRFLPRSTLNYLCCIFFYFLVYRYLTTTLRATSSLLSSDLVFLWFTRLIPTNGILIVGSGIQTTHEGYKDAV